MNPWLDRPFVKMHGGGNDFVVLDDRDGELAESVTAEVVRTLCGRRTGVGSDGLILVERARTSDFGWRFFNSDGSEAEMCGNGARCVARFAFEKEIAPRAMIFDTLAGPVRAVVLDGSTVKLRLPDPGECREYENLKVDSRSLEMVRIIVGVPHVVLFVDDLEEAPVVALGRAVRRHEEFAPAGVNVNFVRCVLPDRIEVRTYERGVEDETLACGTGAVAAALVCIKKGRMSPPVCVGTRGGETLRVHAALDSDHKFREVHLEGKVVKVFQGRLSPEVFV